MVTKAVLKKRMFKSSIQLMAISKELNSIPGVMLSSAIMCTESNKQLLIDIGLETDLLQDTSKNDLSVVVKARDEETADEALERAEKLLGAEAAIITVADRSLKEALEKLPDANIVLISIPGNLTTAVAKQAIEQGLHVQLFSDNVPIDDELFLKELAIKSGLLMMGPGCGTAIINGVPLGFANVVRSGSIGVVSAAGTGLQEMCCLIHRQGEGISQAIGVGGRDLSLKIGGLMMLASMKALSKDPTTKVIVLVSKPPHAEILEKIVVEARKLSKPVVINLLGGETSVKSKLETANTLEEAAMKAVSLVRGKTDSAYKPMEVKELQQIADVEKLKMGDTQRYIRGLFVGGTLCYEALCILSAQLGRPVHTNVDFNRSERLQDSNFSIGDTCIDLGEEEFTLGRLHPMIDPSIRQLRILKEGQDPSTAVLLIDVVLGYGAHPDPVGTLLPVIREVRAEAERNQRYIPVVVSVVGTDRDPQNRRYCSTRLREAGVVVAESNAQAVMLSMIIARNL